MSRPGTPYDNAQAERVIKTLKDAEVHLCESQNFTAARRHRSHCIAEVYNETRHYSALEYRPPAEVERWRGPSRGASLAVSLQGSPATSVIMVKPHARPVAGGDQSWHGRTSAA